MKITFHIHELGRLKDTSFDLYPFLIFTGDSNLGKSYCAFLVHGFFRMLGDEEFINEYLSTRIDLSPQKRRSVFYTLENEEINNMYKAFISKYLRYLVGNNNITVNIDLIIDKDISFEYKIQPYSEKYTLIYEGKTFKGDLSSLPDKLGFRISKILNFRSASRLPILFPPARGSLMGFSFSMKKAISNTGMYEVFLEDIDRIQKNSYDIETGITEIKIHEMLSSIFSGEIKYEKSSSNYLYQFQEKEIPLVSAASSIKELAPLFLLLKNRGMHKINLLFEEPESHLHPSMQRKLADLLAYMVNNGAFLQITTHSDYMLSEWNNLLRLAFIQKIDEKAFEKAVSETGIIPECALNPELVGAYYFQDTENGVKLIKSDISATQQIQFDSFKDTINQMNDNRYILKDILADLTLEKHETTN